MLNTRQKVLRNFWYATLPLERMKDGPQPFRLLGENLVLFLGENDEPAALEDRCCRRTAKLSKGWTKDGRIVCGYHGWQYDCAGKLQHPPVPGGSSAARHMPSDRPGMLMRQRLNALLEAHGEREVPR